MKRLLSIFSIFILIGTTCTGCQLAKPDYSSVSDTLIGAYVTTEYVDTYDLDHNSLSTSGSVSVNQKDLGRIYGTLDKENETITFPGIEGYSLINLKEEENGQIYNNTICDGFSDTCTSTTDNSVEISGTIYYDKSKLSMHYICLHPDDDYENREDLTLTTEEYEDGSILYDYATTGEDYSVYVNPIYQCSNGDIYLMPSTGMMLSDDGDYSDSISCQKTATTNTSDVSTLSKVTVYFKSSQPAEQVTFTQIDKKGNVLQEDSYSSKDFPEIYSRKPDCDYILVTKTDCNDATSYDVINKDEDSYTLYMQSDSFFCEGVSVEITD